MSKLTALCSLALLLGAAPRARAISVTGCVERAVEGGCLLVHPKGGAPYVVIFSSKTKPDVGEAIRVTGAPHEGPTICMQGQALDVKSWTRVRMNCPLGSK
jgi:hypothetical protein